MRKKIISIILAALMLLSMTTVFAETKTNRAVLMCYDDSGKLVYSMLMKKGSLNPLPAQYENTMKKVYLVDTDEIKLWDEVQEEQMQPSESAEPTAEPSDKPEPTAAPSASPSATPKATVSPSGTAALLEDSPYEKAADKLYAPALVTGVSRSQDSDDEEITTLTVYYHGEEITVPIKDSVEISSAPEAFSFLTGQTAASIKEGDVICFAANIAGNKIKELAVLFRPTNEDIITGKADYGTDFEKLIGLANQWSYAKYGSRISNSVKYQYVLGAVAKKSGTTLTLINKSTNPNDALEIDVDKNAYVYTCDVSGKNYNYGNGGIGEISTTLSGKLLDGDEVVLNVDDTFNYALVRIVEGTATDIVVFENYNE